ncbi:MAG: Disheveled-associated activator of morphogenesis 1, partial [Paramarteilia canceri]
NFEFEENWKQVKSLNVVLSDRLKSSNEKISKLEIQSLDLTNKNQASMQEIEALKNSTVPSEEHSNILKKIAEFQEKLKLSEEENNKLKQLQTATLAKPQAKSSQILEDKENIRSEEPKPQEIKPINEVPEPVKVEEKPQPSKEVTNETKKPAENVLKVVETGYISKEATKETEKLTEDLPKVVETADTSKEASNETAKPVEETPKVIDTPKPAAKPKGKKKVMKQTPKVTLPELKAHKLANPTKRFGWIKLATIKETSVWYKMLSDQDRYIDEDYQTILAECFSQKPKVNTNQDSKILIKTENSKIYHVLDSKNAQNFSITIASTKCSPQKLAEKISNSDPTLPTSFISLVHEMLNNKGIISNFNSLEVPMEELYDAEKLLKTVCEIPGINDQLSCILFSRKFNEHYGATESTIDLIKGALDEILAVPEFNQILEIVLKFGNMLNFGMNIGSAYGFQFQTLGSLLDCKIVGGHEYYSNLLDIIVDFVKKKHPELAKFYVSLIEIHSIERSDMAESVREFNNLKMEFEKIEKKFERISSLIEDSNSPFIDKFSKFIGESKDNLKALDLKIEICNKTIHDFCSLYEVDTNSEPINQTVSHIITFANNFAKSSKEIDNKIKKAARINSLAASKPSDSDNRRRSAMPPPKEATNAMMNDLAAILKARKHK